MSPERHLAILECASIVIELRSIASTEEDARLCDALEDILRLIEGGGTERIKDDTELRLKDANFRKVSDDPVYSEKIRQHEERMRRLYW